MGKILIKEEEYTIHSTVKNGKKFSLHLLLKEGKYWALAIYKDHYRLYPPLGEMSLCLDHAPLSDIVLTIGNGSELPNAFNVFVKKGE